MLQGPDQRSSAAAPGERGNHYGSPSADIYRFEDIEVDVLQACLKKNGHEAYVRQQSFHVLLYLLAHRNRLVGKDELISEFWRDTAVTDNAVVQCITEIRKVIGDDSRHPRFIKTVPKVGYRFIGAVDVIPVPEMLDPLEAEPAVSVAAPQAEVASRLVTPTIRAKSSVFRRRRLAVAVIVIGAGLALGWLAMRLFAKARSELTLPAVPGKKSVAVMYFEDQSHRADLEWLREGLADMFIADLTHSRGLTVLSRQQLQLLLNRIGHEPAREIGLDEALDVARQSHAEAVILGSFASLGHGLLVSVQVFDAATGRLLTADRFTADHVTDIFGQVDGLSQKLISQLSVAPADGTSKPSLADSMTKNLEAYRYYSLGVAKAQSFENTQAIALLKKATQLDPQFAMAYARIGYAYSVTDFVPGKGRPYLEKALKLSGRLTKKDRLYVTAWYAIAREDYSAAIRSFRQIVASYPLEIEAYARLARLLFREEQPEEAIAVVQQGLTIDPDAGDMYNVLGVCFLGMKRYDDAIAAHQRYVQLSPKDPNAHDSLGMSFQQSGEYDEALAEYKAALLLDPAFEPAIIHVADTYAQQGRYRDAVGQYKRYIEVAQSNQARAVAYGDIAQIYLRIRDIPRAERAANEEVRYEPGDVWNS
ncbi:MAG: tetratricopeptide repeat protein, partial [Bryobacteraceae bacterium]